MSSNEGSRPTFGFRLAAWYAVLFVGSSFVLIALTYVLLASSLRQRDQEIVQSNLQKYAAAYEQEGLQGLADAIRADRVSGLHETLFVRAIGSGAQAIYLSDPQDWAGFNLARLDVSPPPGAEVWSDVRATGTGDRLEVASVRLPDGIIFQVGKSTRTRDELLARFRAVMLIAFLSVIVIGLTGGAVLTRSALQPLRALSDAVGRIMSTGRMDARVPAPAPPCARWP